MTNTATLNRREFLKLAIAATVSFCIRPQLAGVAALQRGQQQLLPMRLVTLLTHAQSAKAIGSEYLRKYPLEADAQILIGEIASHPAANDIAQVSIMTRYWRPLRLDAIRAKPYMLIIAETN